MNVVLVSSEVAPFSKTGGLGIVVGEIAAALSRKGHRVLTVSPRYGTFDAKAQGAVDTGVTSSIPASGERHTVRFLRMRDKDGAWHVFVEHPMFDRSGIYGDRHGTFGDNHLRFSVLCRAALDACRHVPLDGAPLGEDVVVHAHDWQAALLPVLLESVYRPVGLFKKAASVLTIHNLAHQGRFPARMFADLDLPSRWFAPWAIEYYGDLNYLKGGILHADRVTTVSPTYAQEIRTSWGGFGLDTALRHRGDAVTGILNGIDPRAWDPKTDPHIGGHYDATDLEGKKMCKAALQSELGLPADPTVPVVGSVGRLDPQKGVDLFTESIPWLVEEVGAQVAIVGSAPAELRRYEDHLRWLEKKYPHHVRAWIGYSEPMSHQITAGSDILVMPSLFEPCGLAQMYAQRYGTPPIVRRTGGLADSVIPCDDEARVGTGWTFHMPDGYDLRHALWRALATWKRNPEGFADVMRRGMALDFSWDLQIGEYVATYEAVRALRA